MSERKYFDMVEFSSYGCLVSKLFSIDCLDSIQEALDDRNIDILDYNFLVGVKYGLLSRRDLLYEISRS